MYTRRQFLAASALLTMPAAPPTLSFGFSLYGMKSLSLDEGFEACAKIGYDAVEIACMPTWPSDPGRLSKEDRQRLRTKLRDLKLTLPAVMENLPLNGDADTHRRQLDRLQAAAELGHDLSATAPVLETILGGAPGQWDKLRQQFADRLADWAKIGEKTKTVITIKPHRSNAMNLPEHVNWLIDQVKSPWIQSNYDYSHFQFRDMTIADTVKSLIRHSRFVHVKDVRVDKEKFQFLLPGEGTVDYPALLKALVDGGYRGCVCVEVSGMIFNQKGYDPLAAARKCFENLAPAFEKAGVKRG